ncbi:outer membrane protein OmpA [Castellaniella caeni]|uniref:outer membrane protein OmpA n=1 Tax=Castellaniella caeni TaxID=266123 RepID=UPI00082E526C|nr:OmpA family protein [Castellaniella caeni]
MNKPSKIAIGLAIAAMAAVGTASASDNWTNVDGHVWKDASGENCWRDAFWTPATAAEGCGKPVAEAPVVAPTASKVVLNADTFFDFDKSNLKPEGKQVLDQVAQQAQSINLETIIAVGYTDSIGTVAYNLKLSDRRAASVKQYLISQGVPADRIYTEGKGKADPVATNKTREGRAQNRRVEIEIVGTRK